MLMPAQLTIYIQGDTCVLQCTLVLVGDRERGEGMLMLACHLLSRGGCSAALCSSAVVAAQTCQPTLLA